MKPSNNRKESNQSKQSKQKSVDNNANDQDELFDLACVAYVKSR